MFDFRREIIQLTFRSLCDCIHAFLSSTYISMSFLFMYGAMWIFNIRFDVRFFAVAHSLLGHTGLFVLDSFTEGIRNLAKYLAAQKRIRVCGENVVMEGGIQFVCVFSS